jgi:hypothetical protein
MLVFSLPDFIFWLKEGVLSMSYILFFATPSFRLPSHWVFRDALKITDDNLFCHKLNKRANEVFSDSLILVRTSVAKNSTCFFSVKAYNETYHLNCMMDSKNPLVALTRSQGFFVVGTS